MTAGVQKIFHSDPRIGFLARANVLEQQWPTLAQAVEVARATGSAAALEAANKVLRTNRIDRFNNLLDALVAAVFIVLVGFIVLLSVREWLLLLARRKLARLRESDPVWLPQYALAEGKPLSLIGIGALVFALAKELSGEAHLDRAHAANLAACEHGNADAIHSGQHPKTGQQLYLETTDQRFNGVRRCC
jgi:carbon starvation protein